MIRCAMRLAAAGAGVLRAAASSAGLEGAERLRVAARGSRSSTNMRNDLSEPLSTTPNTEKADVCPVPGHLLVCVIGEGGRHSHYSLCFTHIRYRSAFVPAVASPGRAASQRTRQLPCRVRVHTGSSPRGADRPLPTMVWYLAGPSAGHPGAGGGRADAQVAAGRFPLVVSSATACRAAQKTTCSRPRRWSRRRLRRDRTGVPARRRARARLHPGDDLVNQPADVGVGARVSVASGSSTPGDPFAGHLDPCRRGRGRSSSAARTRRPRCCSVAHLRTRLRRIDRDRRRPPRFEFTAAARPPRVFIHGDADSSDAARHRPRRLRPRPCDEGFLTLHGTSTTVLPGVRASAGSMRS